MGSTNSVHSTSWRLCKIKIASWRRTTVRKKHVHTMSALGNESGRNPFASLSESGVTCIESRTNVDRLEQRSSPFEIRPLRQWSSVAESGGSPQRNSFAASFRLSNCPRFFQLPYMRTNAAADDRGGRLS